MYHSFFIHLFTDGHLGCLQIVAIVNNAAVNIGVLIFFKLVFQVSSDIFPKVESPGYKANPFYFLK